MFLLINIYIRIVGSFVFVNTKSEITVLQVLCLALHHQGHPGGRLHPGAGAHAPHPPRQDQAGLAQLLADDRPAGDRGHRDLVLQGGRQDGPGHGLQYQSDR